MQINIRIRVLLCASLILWGATLSGQVTQPASYGISTKINYIRLWEAKAPEQNSANLITRPVSDVSKTTQYFDGLGRTIQTVSWQAGGNGNDLVSANVYDSLGREQYKYLPFASTVIQPTDVNNDGNFKMNPFQQQASFSGGQYTNETYYYGKIVYESSPLNRVQTSYAPGGSWVGKGNGASTSFLMNGLSDSVQIWNIQSTAGSLPASAGIYAAGQLFKTGVMDEQHHQAVQYVDREGRVVLKKTQLAGSPGTGHAGWLCTYYVYDDQGNLRFVIQPRAVEWLLANGWNFAAAGGSQVAGELCFRYEYDYRNRLIVRKSPGAGEVWIVHDSWDRPVFQQDSVLRAKQQWYAVMYDSQNRIDSVGLMTWTGTRDQLQSLVSAIASKTVSMLPSGATFKLTSVFFYDDYSWVSNANAALGSSGTLTSALDNTNTQNAAYFNTSYNVSPAYAVPIKQSGTAHGLPTGSMIVEMDSTNRPLYNELFYDDHGRFIQSQKINATGGKDIITLQYNFSSKVLRRLDQVQKNGNNSQTHIILSKTTYDAMGRVVSITRTINSVIGSANYSTPEQTIASYHYNALGQLRSRYLGTNPVSGGSLDSLVYDYTIRGWLSGINKQYIGSTSTTPSNYFGEELGYDNTNSVTGITNFANPTLNGLIAGIVWKSAGDGVARKYDFSYDNAGRLTGADFNQSTGTGFDKSAGIDYSVSGLNYDANGNILSMKQMGFKLGGSGPVDQLSYSYMGNFSNRLQSVYDTANDPNSKLGDFHYAGTKSGGAIDYSYDGNGNLTADQNKGISNITYNYLNLPEKISIPGKGTISYAYDASGVRLYKITRDSTVSPSLAVTTLYLGGMVFRNDTLQYISHQEGRTRWAFHRHLRGDTVYAYEFDYFEKDHLGNIRTVLTQQRDTAGYVATMEAAYRNTENGLFYNIPATSAARSSVPNYPNDVSVTNPNDSVAKVNGNGNKMGPAIILKVMSGDVVDVGVNYFYNSTSASGQQLSASDLLTTLASSIVSVTGGLHGSMSDLTGASTPLTASISSFLNSNNPPQTGKPNAYLNWILLDNQFRNVASSSGAIQVGQSGTTSGGGLQAPLGRTGIPITKSGYLYVYVSNASPTDVYFDNLSVKTYSGALVEESHYYPHGLAMAALADKALKPKYAENKNRYNGGTELQNKEFSDGSGLEWYEASWRSYDPQIGRFHQADPMAFYIESQSPYAFAGGNPVMNMDPSGMLTWDEFNHICEELMAIDGGGTWSAGDGGTGGGDSGGDGGGGGGDGSVGPGQSVSYAGGTMTGFSSQDEAFGYGAAQVENMGTWGVGSTANSFADALNSYTRGGNTITGGMVQGLFQLTWGAQANVTSANVVDGGFQINGTVTASGNTLTDYVVSYDLVWQAFGGNDEPTSNLDKVLTAEALAMDAHNTAMDAVAVAVSKPGRGFEEVFGKGIGKYAATVTRGSAIFGGFFAIKNIASGEGHVSDYISLGVSIAAFGLSFLTPVGWVATAVMVTDAVGIANDVYSAVKIVNEQ